MTLAFRGVAPRAVGALRGALETWTDLDGSFWRRLARWGSRGPEWFVRVAPPVVGLVACAVAGGRRRAIAENLRRVRGRRGPVREATEVAQTFVTYASCLAEVLGGVAGGDLRPGRSSVAS